MTNTLTARPQRCLEPSTFASRRADLEQRPSGQPRLISYGTVRRLIEPTGRFQRAKTVIFEYLADVADPSRTYVRALPGGQLQALFDQRPPEEPEYLVIPEAEKITERSNGYGDDPAPEPLGVVARDWTGASSFGSSRSDPPATPIV
ncbi:hypothetical protein SAMN05660199_03960 [Klenkia soli]|uniref:Uncharacterized protein n=1 Tax=Klenkia soli TaxID=1052260 RepID=A0A1H0SY35_9ACTN|nr:hypothetical protein [Klenkia soli]SDP46505.1 hypothetical protein SAMN05660199_03960 [Klenkia soli]